MQLVLIKNFFKLGLFKYSEDVLIFIGSIIISRFIAPNEYGLVAIINVFYGFLNKFSDIGLTAFIIREEDSQSLYITVQFFFIVLSGFLAGILLLLAYPISLFYSGDLLAPCIAYTFIIIALSLPKAANAVLLKRQKFNYIVKIGVISTIFTLGFTLGLALLKFSYWSLIIPQLFPPLISLYFYGKKVRIPFIVPSRTDLTEIFTRCKQLIKNLTIFSVLNYLARNTDNFFIGKLYGKGDLGIYNRAYMFSNLPVNLIGRVFSKIQLPIFQNKIDDLNTVHKQYKLMLNLLTSVIVIPFAALYLFAEEIVVLLWGKNWLAVSEYLPTLSILMLVFVINITVTDMFILLKKDKYIVISASITGSATIVSLTVGVFISIKVMIFMYVITVLLINSPTIMYIGFYKCFNFSLKEILGIWLCNWLTALSLIILQYLNWYEYEFLPLTLLFAVAMIKFIHYLKYLRTEMNQRTVKGKPA